MTLKIYFDNGYIIEKHLDYHIVDFRMIEAVFLLFGNSTMKLERIELS